MIFFVMDKGRQTIGTPVSLTPVVLAAWRAYHLEVIKTRKSVMDK
jgi:hypothetical protein